MPIDESQRTAYYQWLNAVAAEAIYTHVPNARPTLAAEDNSTAAAPEPNPNEWATIARYCDQLPRHELDVFKLRVGYGLKYREIAERLNLPMGTVHSRIARAWQRIQEWAAEAAKPVPATTLADVEISTLEKSDEEQAS